jgi:hypothetical protein
MDIIVGVGIVLILIVVCISSREMYIMTLGDYGKQSPAYCRETNPVNGIICTACDLQCGEYKKNCDECLKRL